MENDLGPEIKHGGVLPSVFAACALVGVIICLFGYLAHWIYTGKVYESNGFSLLASQDREYISQMQRVNDLLKDCATTEPIQVKWNTTAEYKVRGIKFAPAPYFGKMIVSITLADGAEVKANETWLLNGANNACGQSIKFEFKNRGI